MSSKVVVAFCACALLSGFLSSSRLDAQRAREQFGGTFPPEQRAREQLGGNFPPEDNFSVTSEVT